MPGHPRKIYFTVTALLLALLACQFEVGPATPAPTSLPVVEITETGEETPTPVVLTILAPTPCRQGPGEPYQVLHTLAAGDTYDVVGTDAAGEYWIIQLAANLQCWLLAQGASVEGDMGKLTEYSPPVGTIWGIVTVDKISQPASPVENAEVRLKYDPDSPNAYTWVRTNASGKYSFDNVPIGDVVILVPIGDATDGIAQPVSLTDGETRGDVNFLLSSTVPILRPPADLNACSQLLICGTPLDKLVRP
jgi:hypothetical protein